MITILSAERVRRLIEQGIGLTTYLYDQGAVDRFFMNPEGTMDRYNVSVLYITNQTHEEREAFMILKDLYLYIQSTSKNPNHEYISQESCEKFLQKSGILYTKENF